MLKLISRSLFLIALVFNSSLALSGQSDMIRAIDGWCDQNFESCFAGRSFVMTRSIDEIKNYRDASGIEYTYIEGVLEYKNLLGISQTVKFRLKIYPTRIYFYKPSFQYNSQKEEWEWQWEECSRRI